MSFQRNSQFIPKGIAEQILKKLPKVSTKELPMKFPKKLPEEFVKIVSKLFPNHTKEIPKEIAVCKFEGITERILKRIFEEFQ